MGRRCSLATTNGTPALLAMQGAREVVVGAFVNFSAISVLLRAALRGGTDVTLVCAGRDRQYSLEDAACAGRYVRFMAKHYPALTYNDAARSAAVLERRYADDLTRLFIDAEHGPGAPRGGVRRRSGHVRRARRVPGGAGVPGPPDYEDRT